MRYFSRERFFTKDVNAASFSNTQREYINVLSKLMMEGTVTQNMDVYGSVSQGSSGRACLRAAAINNRAAIMAERIDFLDSNWSQYYAVEKEGMQRYLTARSLSAGQSFKDVIKRSSKVWMKR